MWAMRARALYNWLLRGARMGKFMLRIEDTDLERSEARYETQLIEDLHWLGIDWDEGPGAERATRTTQGEYGPYRQSERLEIYAEHTERLLAEGKAYRCFCTPEELEAERAAGGRGAGGQRSTRGRCLQLDAAAIERNLAAGKPFRGSPEDRRPSAALPRHCARAGGVCRRHGERPGAGALGAGGAAGMSKPAESPSITTWLRWTTR
jgi:hypothetical protein